MIDIVSLSKTAAAVTSLGGLIWVGADTIDRRPVLEYEAIKMADLLESKLFKMQEQQVEIIKSINSSRFWNLIDRKKAQGSLSFEEQQELCRVAKQLNYVGIEDCPN